MWSNILPWHSSSVFFCSWFLYLLLYVVAAPEMVEKPGDNSLSRLKSLYTHAKELSETEVRYVQYFFFLGLCPFYNFYKVDIFYFLLFYFFIIILFYFYFKEMYFAPYMILSIVLGCSISTILLNQLDALLPSGPPGQPRRRIGL